MISSLPGSLRSSMTGGSRLGLRSETAGPKPRAEYKTSPRPGPSGPDADLFGIRLIWISPVGASRFLMSKETSLVVGPGLRQEAL